LEFGLQTTNPKLSYFRKKGGSSQSNLRKLSNRKIKYSLDLIAGIPGDTRENFEESIRFAIEEAKPTSLKVFPLRVYEGTELYTMASKNSWVFDQETRIIKRSSTFDEKEVLGWISLGKTVSGLYRFLESNAWFNQESNFRNINFFKKCADKFGEEISEEYNPKEIEKLWRNMKNEK
jgi:radical SAM superfamily enzyme YgiQ (UPF0313 family)